MVRTLPHYLVRLASHSGTQRAFSWLLLLFPFFVGPSFNSIPRHRDFLEPFLERYAYFLLIFILWWPLVAMALAVKAQSTSPSLDQRRYRIHWLILGTLFFCCLIVLGFVRAKLPLNVFYLVIFSISCLTLVKTMYHMGHYLYSVCFEFLGYLTISYASFLLTTFNWSWQPILVSLGLTCMLGATSIARLVATHPQSPKATHDLPVRALIRVQLLLLAAGPAFLAVLCYLAQLEKVYMAPLLTLFLTERLIRQARTFEPSTTPSEWWLVDTRTISAVFIVILSLLALV